MAINLKSLDLQELAAAEQAANVVRKNYEDKIVMYRGVDYDMQMTEAQKKEFAELSQKLSLINGVRLNVLKEMERKLLDIDCK